MNEKKKKGLNGHKEEGRGDTLQAGTALLSPFSALSNHNNLFPSVCVIIHSLCHTQSHQNID